MVSIILLHLNTKSAIIPWKRSYELLQRNQTQIPISSSFNNTFHPEIHAGSIACDVTYSFISNKIPGFLFLFSSSEIRLCDSEISLHLVCVWLTSTINNTFSEQLNFLETSLIKYNILLQFHHVSVGRRNNVCLWLNMILASLLHIQYLPARHDAGCCCWCLMKTMKHEGCYNFRRTFVEILHHATGNMFNWLQQWLNEV